MMVFDILWKKHKWHQCHTCAPEDRVQICINSDMRSDANSVGRNFWFHLTAGSESCKLQFWRQRYATHNLLVTYVLIDLAEASVIGASHLFCGAGRWRWLFTSIWCELKNKWSFIFTPPYAFSAGTVTTLPLLLNVLRAQHCENTIRNLRTDSLLGNGKLYGRMCCRQAGGSEFESRSQISARRPDIQTDIRGLPCSIQAKTEILPLPKTKLRDTNKTQLPLLLLLML